MTKRDIGTVVEGIQDSDEVTHWKIKYILSDIRSKGMLEILNGESSKGHNKKKSET